MKPADIDDLDEALKKAWGTIRATSFTMSLSNLRNVIVKSKGRAVTDKEFSDELTALKKAGKIEFLDDEIVELHE